MLGFPDHHTYSARDIMRLRALAEAHGYTLVTTRKDYVRLSEADREGILPIDVQAQFEDQSALEKLLAAVLGEDTDG